MADSDKVHTPLRRQPRLLTANAARAIEASNSSNEVDPIFAAIEAHNLALGRRNDIIEELCDAEERLKVKEREAWQSYEIAVIALLTTKPTTMAGVIAAMSYVALRESDGPGACETILDGARLSSKSRRCSRRGTLS